MAFLVHNTLFYKLLNTKMTGAIEVKCASEANSNSYLLSARKGLRARPLNIRSSQLLESMARCHSHQIYEL